MVFGRVLTVLCIQHNVYTMSTILSKTRASMTCKLPPGVSRLQALTRSTNQNFFSSASRMPHVFACSPRCWYQKEIMYRDRVFWLSPDPLPPAISGSQPSCNGGRGAPDIAAPARTLPPLLLQTFRPAAAAYQLIRQLGLATPTAVTP